MVSPFETVILRLKDIGAFQFLFPFMITAAIFYGLLRKSQVFGPPETNVAVNGVVALMAAFMVWAYPILAGVDIQTQLSTFFFHSTIALITVIIGLMIAGMFFPPDLAKKIGEITKGGKGLGIAILFGLIVGGSVLFASGLANVFFIPAAALPTEVVITVVALIVLGVIIIAMIIPFGGEKKGG